ncbi:MAG: 2-oxo acid dehydrogenase subunit E2 [Thermoflexales bacterium]|nr:2-oxo acid dehydrogenase subunit E2 [Thermoflexales bacterium]
MAELITMPKLGFDMAEGTLVQWVKKVGDVLAEGDVVAIIETDKANVEVSSFKAGVLRQLLVEEGALVPIGQSIAIIGTADEPLDLGALGVAALAPAAKKAGAAAHPTEQQAPAAPETAGAGRVVASPIALRMASELGVELGQVQGSGPNGRIVKRDIENYLEQRAEQPKPAAPSPVTLPSQTPGLGDYRAEPLTPMRQTIARRMLESKQQTPHFYITTEVDMEAALRLRQELNGVLPEGESISLNDLILKAAAIALAQFPHINASFAGDEIHIHNQVNIGVAVAREAGLVTTVLKDCDSKSLAQIARESRELIARAREGRMRADEMIGGTFSVSNLGMFGVDDFIAIISPPQAAVLAVGAVKRVPVVDEQGQLSVGTRMKVTISADHRVTDGVEAAQFLQVLKQALEQPVRLMV